MNLSPKTLSNLLNQFPELLHVKLKSVDPRDQPITRVRLIPLELAFDIRGEDPQETYFHVEIFAGCSPPHGELWDAQAWQHSLTRYFRNRTKPIGDSEEGRADPLSAVISQLEAETIRVLVGRGLEVHHARACSEILVRGDDNQFEEVISLFHISQSFVFRLTDVREQIKQAASDIPSTEEPIPTITNPSDHANP